MGVSGDTVVMIRKLFDTNITIKGWEAPWWAWIILLGWISGVGWILFLIITALKRAAGF
jgi:hypothetical protein